MLLKELTLLNGVSGNEDAVRDFIRLHAREYADTVTTDSIGNLIAYKRGKASKGKVMLSAHMDEVGFIVTGIGEQGNIKFKTVGGMDERILPGKRVLVGASGIPGVIGCKPVHLQERDEWGANIRLKNLSIDIGCGKKEEAEKLVSLGDPIAFDSDYVEFGDGCIKAKALDDRVGCAILLEALKNEYEFDLYACFTVQEEVGLRGAQVAAYTVNPDIALVLEGTTCSDVPGAEKYEYSTELGKGAALTIMDRTSYPAKNFVDYLYKLAIKNGIDVQFKQTTTGGNDAGKIQQSRGGVTVASLSVPCRYIHSPVSVMSRNDYECVRKLTLTVLSHMSENQEIINTLKSGGNVNV